MAPFWMASGLDLITPALAGRNFLSDQQGRAQTRPHLWGDAGSGLAVPGQRLVCLWRYVIIF